MDGITHDEGRLPLVVTVGFTGHRAIEDRLTAAKRIDAAFRHVEAAFHALAASPVAEAYNGAPRLRLLIGGAPGADWLAAEAWRTAELGEIHHIYPFADPDRNIAYTDEPGGQPPAPRAEPPAEFAPWTALDAAGLGLERDQGHAEVGRWIARHADLLVCWWDGEAGRGAGGANDTVRRALERGLPVVWMKPDDAELRLADPASASRYADAAEAVAYLATIAPAFRAEQLTDMLAGMLAAPGGDTEQQRAEVLARLDYDAHDPLVAHRGPFGPAQWLSDRTLWRSFRLFEVVAGRTRAPQASPDPPPPSVIAQPGYGRLIVAAGAADLRADYLGGIHRSEQLWLIFIAVVAVFSGAVPAVMDHDHLANVHFLAAIVEFGLGALALIIAGSARMAHRHRRWSDARRLAERMRGALSTWPLGFDVADDRVGATQTWTEWRARAVLRAAGPRRGWITLARFNESADWAGRQLLDGQMSYHNRQGRAADRIERTMRGVEDLSFLVLMTTLFVYIVWTFAGPVMPWQAPPSFGGFVTLISAVTPAVAAGCVALDATNGFGELAARSARIKAELERLKARLTAPDTTGYHPRIATIRRAAQLLVEDADAWRDRLMRRRIVRG